MYWHWNRMYLMTRCNPGSYGSETLRHFSFHPIIPMVWVGAIVTNCFFWTRKPHDQILRFALDFCRWSVRFDMTSTEYISWCHLDKLISTGNLFSNGLAAWLRFSTIVKSLIYMLLTGTCDRSDSQLVSYISKSTLQFYWLLYHLYMVYNP